MEEKKKKREIVGGKICRAHILIVVSITLRNNCIRMSERDMRVVSLNLCGSRGFIVQRYVLPYVLHHPCFRIKTPRTCFILNLLKVYLNLITCLLFGFTLSVISFMQYVFYGQKEGLYGLPVRSGRQPVHKDCLEDCALSSSCRLPSPREVYGLSIYSYGLIIP